MALTTEQLSKLTEWVGSQLGKAIGAIVAVALTALAVYLPTSLAIRLLLLTILALATLALWLSLRVIILEREKDSLKAASSKIPSAQLSEMEISILCFVVDARGAISRRAIVQSFQLEKNDAADALEHLSDLELVKEGFDSDFMLNGDFVSTRKGRQHVRDFRGAR